MNVDMDSIAIDIQSTSEKASESIGQLIVKLEGLQTALSNVGKSSKNKFNLKEQLDSMKINLKNYDVSNTFTSQNSKGVTTEITKYKNVLGDVVTVQKKMKDGMEDYYRVTQKTAKDGVSSFKKFKDSIESVATILAKVYFGVTRTWKGFSELIETSAEYTEAVNLFYTEMGDKAQEAEGFVKKFSEALYLDPADVMQYMGSFNSLVSGLGVGADNSYKMSKNLTQLAYDLASYKNLGVDQAFDKLQSGIAGQIKGLRQVGVALSQNTLQELANELGIQRKINTLDEASKAQLRYIQIMRSSTNWQGDLGKTMMSTENILKAARQQWTLMVRALGDVAAVIARVVMPYFIALTQIVKEAAVSLAKFFGLDIDFSDRFKDGGKSASVGLGKIEDGIGGVGSAAKKAKKDINSMLAPFDDLNVVQTKLDNAGSGIGGGATGGYSLGDLPLPEYDALSKLTSEWSDKIADARKKIEEIIPIAKKLLIIFGTMWAIGKIAKFINNIKTIGSVFRLLKTPTSTFGKLLKTLGLRFSDGYKYAKALGGKGLSAVLSGTRNLLGPLGKLGVTLAGAIISFDTGYTEMKKYAKGTEDLTKALTVATAVTAAFGVAAFALVGWPAALVVGIAGLTGALAGYAQGLYEIEVRQKIFTGQGLKFTEITHAMISSLDATAETTLKYANTIESLGEKYVSSKSEMESARDGVSEFVNMLALQDDKISSSQIDELKSKYQTLKEETKATQKASDDYYIAVIKANGEATNSSNERTAQEIANYKKIASAKAGMDAEYLAKEEEITLAWANKKITLDEYNKKIQDLKVNYGYASSATLDATKMVESFGLAITELDFENPKKLKENVDSLKTSYDNNITAINNYKAAAKKTYDETTRESKRRIEQLEEEKLRHGGLTKEQQNNLDTLTSDVTKKTNLYKEQVKIANETATQLGEKYKGYLGGIYAELVSRGADTSSEFKGTISGIKGEIGTLKDVKIGNIGQGILDEVTTSIANNKPNMVKNVKTALDDVGMKGSSTFNKKVAEQIQLGMPNLSKNINDQFKPLGKSAADGVKKGIDDNKTSLNNAGKNIGTYVVDGTRTCLGWHSPSTVYEQAGKDVILGFKKGLENNKKLLIDTMTTILNDLNKTTSKELKNIKFEINATTFQNSLDKLLGKLQTFSNKFRSGVNSLLSTFTTSMNGIKVGNDNKLYYTKMPNITIPRFDDGGYPDRASLFWANENGIPEMVGRIGNQTAVANNDQITTSITNALITALSGMNFGGQGTTVVNIGNKKVYEGMGEYLDGESERYGTAYVNI